MKVIIYGRNVHSVAAIFKYFSYALEEEQFLDGEIAFTNRLIAMFHRSTDEESKSRVLSEFKKPDSQVRLVVATSSFEMGVDFPDVSIIINFGMPSVLPCCLSRCCRLQKRSLECNEEICYSLFHLPERDFKGSLPTRVKLGEGCAL